MHYSLLSYFVVTAFTWAVEILLMKHKKKTSIDTLFQKKTLYLLLPSALTILFAVLYILIAYYPSNSIYLLFQYSFALYAVIYIPKFVYLIFKLALTSILQKRKNQHTPTNRRNFIKTTSLAVAAIPFGSLFYGLTVGRLGTKHHYVNIKSPKISSSLTKLKIVQISDIHLGSLKGFDSFIKEMIDAINEQKPDIVCFTGDLVNNFSYEAIDYINEFKRINSKYGKFAILGNHDYGDYSEWETDADKEKNLKSLCNTINQMGFTLLHNQNSYINIGQDKIGIAGVGNWSKSPRLPSYSDLHKASIGIDQTAFNILLTHNPDHWEDEVVNKTPYDLTLSGHTHGLQIGFEYKEYKFSPVQWIHKHWAGLYRYNHQWLYVNRGFGTIGFPGRLGMPPEITIITLQHSDRV